MRNTGKVLDNQGRKYGISPFFIAAVAGKESSYGAAACRNNPKNVWGLGQCGRVWRVPYFETWTEAINFFVRFITGNTNITSGWPNATTPYQFYQYCSGCEQEWGAGVSRHMYELGVTPRVKYKYEKRRRS